jgi:hypothetical protein
MKFDVEITITGSGTIQVEAATYDDARQIVELLNVEVDICFPPTSVDDSCFDRFAELVIDGVSEADPEDQIPDPQAAQDPGKSNA